MEKISLFNELKKGGYESSIITTFNAYFPFYEEVLLRRLRSCGVQKNIVFMDSNQCKAAIEQSYPLLSGRHYTLAPMNCNAAFHPKIVLLLGKRKGLLAVGSHNLTFSGYGANAEITNVIRFKLGTEEGSLALFWKAWLAIQAWVDDYGKSLSTSVKKNINTSIDDIDWLVPTEPDDQDEIQFYFSSSSTDTLWSQVEPWIPESPQSCMILGAFFDKKLRFIRQFQKDVKPKKLLIGVQPSTVHVPTNIIRIDDLKVVNSESMIDESNSKNSPYIHAKSIYVKDKQHPVLISGSANPSSPAWLLKGERCNAEAVIVRLDNKIMETANSLGFEKLEFAKLIDKLDSKDESPDEISNNLSKIELIIGTIQNNKLLFSWPVGSKNTSIYLESADNRILKTSVVNKTKESNCITLRGEVIRELSAATIKKDNKVLAKILLYFSDEIEAITAKGVKKKFRDAMGSLETESPELKLLFNSLDKIIFENKESSQKKRSSVGQSNNSNNNPENNSQSLVVDWEGISGGVKNKPKRLKVSDDLTNLLDAFVYGLGYEATEVNAFSGEDKFGRNEEELVGSDDEIVEDTSSSKKTQGITDDEKLELCNRRLKRLSNKIIKGLELLKKNEISHIEILPKLLAVLSLFKELNQRAKQFVWIKELYTILPFESMELVFSKICESWWGSSYGLVQGKGDDDKSLIDIDELVRLRGVLIWMAWYTEIIYQPKSNFSEDIDNKNTRLWSNAVYILLAQLIVSDELVEEEASKICAAESNECLNWFIELVRFSKELDIKYKRSKINIKTLPIPTKEGWILHRNEAFSGIRYANNVSEGKVTFACASKKGNYRSFIEANLAAID